MLGGSRLVNVRFPRRAALAVVALLVVAGGVSGCAAVAGNIADQVAMGQARTEPPKLGPDAKPGAGDCWKSTYKNANEYADWNNSKPVSCYTTHQLYTYAVPALKGTYTGSEYNSSNYLKMKLANETSNLCNNVMDEHLPPVDPSNSQRLDVISLVPTTSQWNDGARWVRCDVGLIAFGSKYDDPVLENLPSLAKLTSLMRSKAPTLAYCANDPQGSAAGPYSKDAVYANCEDHPEWFLADRYSVPSPSGSYPSRDTMTAVYRAQCQSYWSNATHVTFPYYPSKSDWASGYQVVECWVGKK